MHPYSQAPVLLFFFHLIQHILVMSMIHRNCSFLVCSLHHHQKKKRENRKLSGN